MASQKDARSGFAKSQRCATAHANASNPAAELNERPVCVRLCGQEPLRVEVKEVGGREVAPEPFELLPCHFAIWSLCIECR